MLKAAEAREAGTLGAGGVLRLVRDGTATTRNELAEQSGLSRSTLADRVQSLLALELLQEITGVASTGGRPPATLTFNRSAGAVLVADLDTTHCRVAVCDLSATPLAEHAFAFDVTQPPEAILAEIQASFTELLNASTTEIERVRAIGIGVQAPVAFARGEPVDARMMPGWDGFSIPTWFATHYEAPVLVDSHVNLMALGEHWTHWRAIDHLLYVTVGQTIECGIVAGRDVHRGAHGAAGDIGHVRLAGHDDVLCPCGNSGCLEAVAGGDALAANLTAVGLPAGSSRDVVAHARAGEPLALQAVREAGRAVGEVLAECVNFFNPGAIIIGGDLSEAPQQLLAGVREAAIGRSLPMATRDLRMGSTRLGVRAGMIGAAVMVIEHVLAPENVDRAVHQHTW
jgi:predicted NBD/HSP70 family sugar kinase